MTDPIPPETRARWAYWLDRGLLPDVTPDEAVAIWRRLLAALAEAERARDAIDAEAATREAR